MLTYTIDTATAGTPLLDYLQQEISLAQASYLNRLIRSGKVLCNGESTTAGQILRAGDTITLPGSRKLISLIERQARQPQILYESDKILVVAKPSGLATHSSRGHEQDNLNERVREMLLARGKKFKTAAIHRLDLPTSGPVIFGKGQKAISELGKLMQQRGIEKKYLALTLAGLPKQGRLQGTLDSKGKTKVAECDYRVITQNDEIALHEIVLGTGRQHQIRRQMAEVGFPIAGDKRYRGPDLPGLNRLFLHAFALTFTDPFGNEAIKIKDPLPDDLTQLLEHYDLSCPDTNKY